MSVDRYRYGIALVSLLGVSISIYALYVEHMLDSDANYRPMCDIASYISCSTAFRSFFAKGLGIIRHFLGERHSLTQRNPTYGCAFYTLMFLVQFSTSRTAIGVTLVLSMIVNCISVYLVLILIYLRTICVVCVSIHFINALLLYLSLKRLNFHTYRASIEKRR